MILALAGAAASDAAFDTVAADYDRNFTHTCLGRWLREPVQRALGSFAPGQRVLELGCGTGEDAVWLAQRGVRVVAVDASAAMLAVADDKARRAGVRDRVELLRVDLEDLDGFSAAPAAGRMRPEAGAAFDGCVANFGVVNCVRDRERLASALARLLVPGARLFAVTMGPFCLSEVALYATRGRPRDAVRRLRQGHVARVGDRQLPVWYPSPRRLRVEFAPHFRAVARRGIGVLLPPSQFAAAVERRPALWHRLRAWDERLARPALASWIADHYLLVLERR